MTGLSRTSADLSPRAKRILFRAWHRGTREMDLLMGRFAEHVIGTLDADAMAPFEVLIELEDRDLFAWLTGAQAVPPEHDTPLYRALKAFHRHDQPLEL